MYKIKQNLNFGLGFLLVLALSGVFQWVTLSQAQAKLSAGDYQAERMNRGQEPGEMAQSQSLEKKLVSKVILNDEQGQPLCVADIRENPDLSPPFATPAPPDFNSSLSVDLRPCDLSEMDFIHYAGQNSALGPTQVAGLPLIPVGAWALFSCVAGAGIFVGFVVSDNPLVVGTGVVGAVAGAIGAGMKAGAGAAALAGVSALACFGGTIATLYFILETGSRLETD